MKFNGHILAQEYSIQVYYTGHAEADHKEQGSCSESLAFILSGILSGALPKNFAAHYLVVILVVRGNFLRLFQGHKCIPKQYACRAVCFCVDVLLD